jgi:hypothetical protein
MRTHFIVASHVLLCMVPIVVAEDVVKITIDKTRPIGISQLQLGVTHTQYSLDPWGNAEAIARGKKMLAETVVYQNQHIMGWGAGNPNPAPGVYDFKSLDARMKLIESIGGTPVITLCACPDWMKGGKAGETDWKKIEVAPLPEHYEDFANLAKVIAHRYPQVKHYQVWNEMKGFWDARANNWNYRNYTRMYNLVYDALKSVSKEIKVGGPYLVIEGSGSGKGGWAAEKPIRKRQMELLEYWLENKHGAQFITLDRGVKGGHDENAYTDAELMNLTPVFGDVARQIAKLTNLPIWWAEYYGAKGSPEFVAAHYASIYYHMITSNTDVALLWGPQEGGLGHGLFTDTRKPGGAQPLPHHEIFKMVNEYFGPGTLLYATESSSPDVEAAAGQFSLMLINKRPTPVTVDLPDGQVKLKGYGVERLQRNPDGP